jgi:hypothetical protein
MIPTKSRPDFSGVWELNFERSILRGSAPKRVLVRIEHREPRLIQQIHLTKADSTEQWMTFTYETDAETTNSIGEATARTQARWEGTELVIESWMKAPGREFHFKDHWSLSEDGRTLTMAHRDDDLAGQISLLEKRSQAQALTNTTNSN